MSAEKRFDGDRALVVGGYGGIGALVCRSLAEEGARVAVAGRSKERAEEVARSLGADISRSRFCGGGSRSPLWRKIFANVLGIPLEMVKTEQGPGYGAAMLAMVGGGLFPSVEQAAGALTEIGSVTEPEPELTALYEDRYRRFRRIYPALRPLFPELL